MYSIIREKEKKKYDKIIYFFIIYTYNHVMKTYDKIEELNQYLHICTDSEQWHLEHPGKLSRIYHSLPKRKINGKDYYYFDFSNTIQDKYIAIIKESRFTTVPEHINKDMQAYFVYEGSCVCNIGKTMIHMVKGDILFLDSETIHSFPVEKKEKDIIINIVLKKEYFNSIFLSRFTGDNIFTNFLFDAISNRRREQKYLFFHSNHIPQIYILMQFLLCNYFFSKAFHKDIIDCYISTIFHELVNSMYNDEAYLSLEHQNRKTLKIIKYIEENYKTCTLETTAAQFGYSPNYLGNYIKRETGKTYSEIKLMQQLSEAAFLLSNTNKSVIDIIEKVNITNLNYFYEKFKHTYGYTPKQYRKITQTHLSEQARH